MERALSSYTGCLLGLAVGDGLGSGPERLNGFLPTSGYTQMAAYACNGLLLGLTQGQMTGAMAPPVRYVALALEEWAGRQMGLQGPEPVRCWISRTSRLDHRRCPEGAVLELLAAGELGTMEDHSSTLSGPGALMTAAAVGLFFDPERLQRRELQRLGAESAALTHGDPAAFLSGAALAHILSRIVWDGERDLARLSAEAGAMLRRRFGREYHQAFSVSDRMKKARALARSKHTAREDALAQLGCETADQVLASAVYCCLTDADGIRTPGVGAVAGAVLGALGGVEKIPARLLEELEEQSVLRELAEDLYRGCPMMRDGKVFDVEWDAKYVSPEL